MKKHIGINVDKSLYDWLKIQSEKNQRSLTGQIIFLLNYVKDLLKGMK